MKILNVLGIGQGKYIPSYRYRLKETVHDFENNNINLTLFETNINSYPPKNKIYRIIWMMSVLLNRFPLLFKQFKYDAIILQRELISTLYTYERFLKVPYILDVDDAIHLKQKFSSIDKIAKKASAIVVCNDFLFDYYKSLNKNVYIIPTPVNIDKYTPLTEREKDSFVIGWIGTSSNFKSLKLIEKQLNLFLQNNPESILKVISNEDPLFEFIPKEKYVFKQWSDKTDVLDIQSFSVGIMPLSNNEHSRGKCAFKMLQYMSCEIPVISSCFPMNKDILQMGECGYCIDSYNKEWNIKLQYLYQNRDKCEAFGLVGRQIIEKNFSTVTYAQSYKTVLDFLFKKDNQ